MKRTSPRARGIVEKADVAIADLAAQHGREAVRRHVQHRLAGSDGVRNGVFDGFAIRPIVRGERRGTLLADSDRVYAENTLRLPGERLRSTTSRVVVAVNGVTPSLRPKARATSSAPKS